MKRQEKKIRYRLTKGLKPESWQLPIKGMMINKVVDGINKGMKRIHYIPGIAGVFVEDYEGDEKPRGVFFEKGILDVDPNDHNLLFILKNHRYLGVHFELVDDDSEALKELDKMEMIEKAIAKVNVADEIELKANAIAIIGYQAISWSEVVARKTLKKMAFESPKEVLETMNNKNYAAKYVASLAILKGVLVINETQTAVSWADGKNIVRVAAGQSALEKISDYLSENNEESTLTLQEIGDRIKRSYTKRANPTGEEEINDITSKKTETESTDNGDKDLSLQGSSDPGSDTDDVTTLTLEDAQEAYKVKFGKDVANAKKNDLDWILSKLKEDAE